MFFTKNKKVSAQIHPKGGAVEDDEISSYTFAHLSLKMLRYLSYIFERREKRPARTF
jgi:hypothetical protein